MAITLFLSKILLTGTELVQNKNHPAMKKNQVRQSTQLCDELMIITWDYLSYFSSMKHAQCTITQKPICPGIVKQSCIHILPYKIGLNFIIIMLPLTTGRETHSTKWCLCFWCCSSWAFDGTSSCRFKPRTKESKPCITGKRKHMYLLDYSFCRMSKQRIQSRKLTTL